jgi:hypothetical protein
MSYCTCLPFQDGGPCPTCTESSRADRAETDRRTLALKVAEAVRFACDAEDTTDLDLAAIVDRVLSEAD